MIVSQKFQQHHTLKLYLHIKSGCVLRCAKIQPVEKRQHYWGLPNIAHPKRSKLFWDSQLIMRDTLIAHKKLHEAVYSFAKQDLRRPSLNPHSCAWRTANIWVRIAISSPSISSDSKIPRSDCSNERLQQAPPSIRAKAAHISGKVSKENIGSEGTYHDV